MQHIPMHTYIIYTCTLTFKEEARAYFNCSTLEGVELENQGASGTRGMHWEARILGVGHSHEHIQYVVDMRVLV